MRQARASIQALLFGGLAAGCATSTGPGSTDYGIVEGGVTSPSSSGAGGTSGSSGSSKGPTTTNPSGGDDATTGNSGSSGSSSAGSNGDDAGDDSSTSSSGGGSSSGSTVTTSGSGPKIPAAMGACPTLKTGNITVSGQTVAIAAGSKGETPAPIVFYWHATGTNQTEVDDFFASEQSEVVGEGGLVASFTTSTKTGTDTGDDVWYTGDFAMADQILACAVQQLNIDTRRIYSAGCSAGALQASAMLYERSAYMAAVMPNSGGSVIPYALQDPSHVPALITTHGGSSDMVIISFASASATQDKDVASKGGFVVDCNHGGGHCGAPANDIASQWQFCKDHPFGVSPEPYANGLPKSFPSYCVIIPK